MGHPRVNVPVMCTYMSVSPKTKKFSNKEEPIKMLLSHFRLIVDAEAAWQAWYQLNCNDGQKES